MIFCGVGVMVNKSFIGLDGVLALPLFVKWALGFGICMMFTYCLISRVVESFCLKSLYGVNFAIVNTRWLLVDG